MRPVDLEDRSDLDLLDLFVGERDEAAFEALTERHGRMVRAVCARVLGGPLLVDDTYQAVFLVLVFQAPKVRRKLNAQASLGPWLHRVARNAAIQAKRAESARRRRENVAGRRRQEASATADGPWSEALPLLDEEIQSLPDRYRTALILCDLEDRTQREVADRLGLAYGTLRRRLEEARELLRYRLMKRGVALSAILMAELLRDLGCEASTAPYIPPLGGSNATSFIGSWPAKTVIPARAGVTAKACTLGRAVVRSRLRYHLTVSLAGAVGVAVALTLALSPFAGANPRQAVALDPKPIADSPAPPDHETSLPQLANAPTSRSPGTVAVPPPRSVTGKIDSHFVGEIAINGEVTRFDNLEDFERAQKQMSGALPGFAAPFATTGGNNPGSRPYGPFMPPNSFSGGFSASTGSLTFEVKLECCCKDLVDQIGSKPASCCCKSCPTFPDPPGQPLRR